MLSDVDRIHPAGAGDDWFESWWFAFYVPERLLTVYVYPWFRLNLGICGGGVFAWDDRGHLPWTLVHHDYHWSRRFDGEAAMLAGSRLMTPQGITIETIESGTAYRLTYERPDFAFDVRFDATIPVETSAAPTAESGVFRGHIDQPGRYTGWVRVGPETLAVDCHCIRDRSWGPRGDDVTDMHFGYFHATASASDAFMIVMRGGADPEHFSPISGYLVREGIHAPLREGSAQIERAANLAPATCRISATDTLGRSLEAEGHRLTSVAVQVQPGMFNWSSLARWRFGDATAYGELQDTWHPDGYRTFARERTRS